MKHFYILFYPVICLFRRLEFMIIWMYVFSVFTDGNISYSVKPKRSSTTNLEYRI